MLKITEEPSAKSCCHACVARRFEVLIRVATPAFGLHFDPEAASSLTPAPSRVKTRLP